ncbi:hypothetical protein S245_017212 [Arachis hypogaea]
MFVYLVPRLRPRRRRVRRSKRILLEVPKPYYVVNFIGNLRNAEGLRGPRIYIAIADLMNHAAVGGVASKSGRKDETKSPVSSSSFERVKIAPMVPLGRRFRVAKFGDVYSNREKREKGVSNGVGGIKGQI